MPYILCSREKDFLCSLLRYQTFSLHSLVPKFVMAVLYFSLRGCSSIWFLLLFYWALCVPVKLDDPSYFLHQRRGLQMQKNGTVYPHSNSTNSTIDEASKLVAEAVAQQSKYNAYRVAHPRRNTYRSEPSAQLDRRDQPPAPPVLEPKLLAAAALLAEHDALQKLANGTLHRGYQEFTQLPKSLSVSPSKKRSSAPYWPSQVDHGQPPMGWDPSYPVREAQTAIVLISLMYRLVINVLYARYIVMLPTPSLVPREMV